VLAAIVLFLLDLLGAARAALRPQVPAAAALIERPRSAHQTSLRRESPLLRRRCTCPTCRRYIPACGRAPHVVTGNALHRPQSIKSWGVSHGQPSSWLAQATGASGVAMLAVSTGSASADSDRRRSSKPVPSKVQSPKVASSKNAIDHVTLRNSGTGAKELRFKWASRERSVLCEGTQVSGG